MAEVVRMPKMSDTMTEGVLAKWHKKVGDKVKTGDVVAEIETDKATMEFESYQEGTLLYVGINEGQAVPVDAIIAVLGKEGEDYKALLESEAKPAAAAKEETKPAAKEAKTELKKEIPKETPKTEKAVEAKPLVVQHSASNGVDPNDKRIKASPLAKKLAEDKGINLGMMMGSGENGRIVKRDIDWFKPGMSVSSGGSFVASGITEESFEEVPVSQMRKTIAKRLTESKFSAPHFYLTMEINMDKAIDARESINAMGGAKISFNDFVLKASAVALRQHPKVNSSWLGDKIRYNHHINIGVAVAVEEGLLVPVVRYADTKTLSQISQEVKEYGWDPLESTCRHASLSIL